MAGVNWNDKALLAYGGVSILPSLQGKLSRSLFTSDVWVYFVDTRRWIRVRTPNQRPAGRIMCPLTSIGNNSFILLSGLVINVSPLYEQIVRWFLRPDKISTNSLEELFVLQTDMWLLTLSDCSPDCPQRGIYGHWRQIMHRSSPWDRMPSARLGHSAVYVEDKLFVLGGVALKNNAAACKSDFWSYDFWTARWSNINPPGDEVFHYLQLPLFCNIPMTVFGKRIVILFPNRFNGTHDFKVASYFSNT